MMQDNADGRRALVEHCNAERRSAQRELAIAVGSYRLLSVTWVFLIVFMPRSNLSALSAVGVYLTPLFCLAYLWRLSVERFRSTRLLLDQNYRELALKGNPDLDKLFIALKEGLREIREDRIELRLEGLVWAGVGLVVLLTRVLST
jgi:hypothetical protein